MRGAQNIVAWHSDSPEKLRTFREFRQSLSGISRDLHRPAARDSELGALASVLDTLHRDCAEPLRIEKLAEKSGLSWSQFQRRVRSVTCLTPSFANNLTHVEAQFGS